MDYVILSHLDIDHASGLILVSDCNNIIVSNEEIKDSRKHKLRYDSSIWRNVQLKGFSFNNGIGPVNKSLDLFNDGKVVLVNTPGHSHGHTSLLLNDNNKFVLLAGDAIYSRKSYQDLILMGFTVSNKLALKSIKWIKELSLKENCIDILANHDSDVNEEIIEL